MKQNIPTHIRPSLATTLHTSRLGWALVLTPALAVSACAPDPQADQSETEQTQSEAQPPQTPTDTPAKETADAAAQDDQNLSILRPEIDPPEPEPDPVKLKPYRATIQFAEGGSKLDAEAIETLEQVLASPQMPLDLPITLSAHSDSAGSDEVNLDASEERGLAVAKWLIEKGVDADRITVIAFGEQNPLKPNALRDGAPNEKGRAANRRVEIEISAVNRRTDQGDSESPAQNGSVQTGN